MVAREGCAECEEKRSCDLGLFYKKSVVYAWLRESRGEKTS